MTVFAFSTVQKSMTYNLWCFGLGQLVWFPQLPVTLGRVNWYGLFSYLSPWARSTGMVYSVTCHLGPGQLVWFIQLPVTLGRVNWYGLFSYLSPWAGSTGMVYSVTCHLGPDQLVWLPQLPVALRQPSRLTGAKYHQLSHVMVVDTSIESKKSLASMIIILLLIVW